MPSVLAASLMLSSIGPSAERWVGPTTLVCSASTTSTSDVVVFHGAEVAVGPVELRLDLGRGGLIDGPDEPLGHLDARDHDLVPHERLLDLADGALDLDWSSTLRDTPHGAGRGVRGHVIRWPVGA